MNRVASGGDIAKQERFGISSPNFLLSRLRKKQAQRSRLFRTLQARMTQISKRPAAIDAEARQGQAASRS
ncbi:MAG TPA: hypothetical protein VKU03_13250, partial [Roseiarcus sp.]|nr:hypothetical protein [Roseiarcus sp.]